MRAIARLMHWEPKSSRTPAMDLWAEFILMLEYTIREENLFDGTDAWLVVRERRNHVRVRSTTYPSFGVDMEFVPLSLRVACVFMPSKNARVYEFCRQADSPAVTEMCVSYICPKQLAASLIDLMCFAGKD